MNRFPHLFSPITIRGLPIRNRILSSAHGTGLAEGAGLSQVNMGVPGPRITQYHGARARGGAGVIITEGTVVYPQQEGWAEAWKPVIEDVRRHGARVFNQIVYGGRQVSGIEVLRPTYAPSPLPWLPGGEYPREMSRSDIALMVKSFADAGRRMAEAGFDGIEIHGAHGYLVHEFMSPDANRRCDDYGGTTRNRARFPLEVVQAVREALPTGVILGMRVSAEEHIRGGLHLDEALDIIELLTESGCLDYLSVSAGSYKAMPRVIPGMYLERGLNASLGKAVKERSNLPVFLVGRILEPGLADQLIEDGCADMVAMTRAMIADPEMPRKAEEGRLEDIRYCMGINQGCWGRVRAGYGVGCVLNPEAGREQEFAESSSGAQHKSVLVLGGGPAGCEAARQLALKGHQVTLCEKTAALGGAAALAALAPGRGELSEISRWYTHELTRLRVDLRLGLEVTEATLAEFTPDAVVMATGAKPIIPSVKGLESCGYWLTIADALGRRFDPGRLVLIYSVSRGVDVLTVADRFCNFEGTKVILATPHDAPGKDVDDSTIVSIMARLALAAVQVIPWVEIADVGENHVALSNVLSGYRTVIESVDTLVVDYGWEPVRDLEDTLSAQYPGVPLTRIGDCLAPRGIQAAVWDGAAVRMRI